MGNALAKHRLLRRLGVDVDRIGVRRHSRIEQDICLGDRLTEAVGLTDLQVLKEVSGGHVGSRDGAGPFLSDDGRQINRRLARDGYRSMQPSRSSTLFERVVQTSGDSA